MATHNNVMATTLSVALSTLVFGLATLTQELLIASAFGTSYRLDAFQLAFLPLSVLANVVAGGALHAAFVPTYVRIRSSDGTQGAKDLFASVSVNMLGLLLVAALLLGITFSGLLDLYASGQSQEAKKLSVSLFYILLPMLLFGGICSLFSSTLNALGYFAYPSLSQIFVPVMVIISILLLKDRFDIFSLAYGFVVGYALQLVAVSGLLIRKKQFPRSKLKNPSPYKRKFIAQYLSVSVSAMILGGMALVDQAMAATLETGSVSALAFATRPVTMFMAFSTVVIGNATLPYFSEVALISGRSAILPILKKWIIWIFLGGMIVTLGWEIFAEDIIKILYQRGAFTSENTTLVTEVQRYYIIQIPFYLCGIIGMRAINALNENKKLLVISMGCLLLNIGTGYICMKILGLGGIALSKSIVFIVWVFWILAILNYAPETKS